MKINRLLLVLVLLTIALQATLLYRQYRRSSAQQSAQSQIDAAEIPAVQNAPDGMSIDLTAMPIKGRSDAKIVLVEYSDYQCPFCARHTAAVEPELERIFVDSGRIRYAFANNPLPFHLNAKPLAIAAICAGNQGHYWEMHDALFAKQPTTMDGVLSIAQSLKLNVDDFKQCRDSSAEPNRQIERDRRKAQELQMDFTPGFALGIADGNGRVQVRKLISGAQPLDVFTNALDELLAQNDVNAKQ